MIYLTLDCKKNHVKTRKLTALLKTRILNQGYTWNTQYSTAKVALQIVPPN